MAFRLSLIIEWKVLRQDNNLIADVFAIARFYKH